MRSITSIQILLFLQQGLPYVETVSNKCPRSNILAHLERAVILQSKDGIYGNNLFCCSHLSDKHFHGQLAKFVVYIICVVNWLLKVLSTVCTTAIFLNSLKCLNTIQFLLVCNNILFLTLGQILRLCQDEESQQYSTMSAVPSSS